MSTKTILKRICLGLALTGLTASVGSAQMTKEAPNKVSVTGDIVYGKGVIRKNGKQVVRYLWMDFYKPLGARGPLPTVIYTHGGSFHIGGPRTAYSVSGAKTTSPADYCKMFASWGYACFAIQYRLAPEEPVASGKGYSPAVVDAKSVGLMLDRVGVIRGNLGLRKLNAADPKDQKLLSDTVLSAAEDLRAALDFVIKNATKYDVDPRRIVLGGFSAGAVTSLNVAHGMNAPVAGAFMLSTAPIGLDIFKTVTQASKSVPVLIFMGQHDLSGALIATPKLLAHYKKVGVDATFAWVPGFGHFYPSGAVAMTADATMKSVDERIFEFLAKVTGK